MSAVYYQVTDLARASHRIVELGAKTAVVDIEPLVAFWDTGQSALRQGVITVLAEFTETTTLRAVVFATNSTRTLPAVPAIAGLHIGYLASARKPLRTSPYRDLPRPGVVIGDQVATDGLLAYRLEYVFLHYCPELPYIPRGPRMMRHLGRPIRTILFHTE